MPPGLLPYEYFQKFNKPLPEQFCTKKTAAPQASEEPPRSLRKPMRTRQKRPRLSGTTMVPMRMAVSARDMAGASQKRTASIHAVPHQGMAGASPKRTASIHAVLLVIMAMIIRAFTKWNTKENGRLLF